jgi:peptide/nickel transport system substrate-binding protein
MAVGRIQQEEERLMTYRTILRARGVSALALVAALSAGTAIAQDAPSGTLTIGWQWDPGTMDPQMHRQRYTQIISGAMRDKLFTQPPPGLARAPQVAESIVQVDETTYDVKLREGVLFHNGDELRSDDIVYTFQRLWDPATASPRARMGNMANAESVEAVDQYTVRFKSKLPFGPPDEASLGFHLQGQEILHKATYEALTLDEARTHPVMGVGPFKFVEWLPEQRVVMEAFEDYWQGAPGVERIIWRTIPEESTRVAELLAGSIDMIHPVTPDFVPQLRAAGMKMEIVAGASSRMVMMNVREGSPFADPEVRRAMNMAIDKQSIVDFLYAGLALPSTQVPGIGQEGYIEGYSPFSFDPEAARPILSQVTQPIEMFVQPGWVLPAEAVAEQLRGYGMNVTAVVLDNASFNQTNERGSFDLLFAGAGYGSGDFTGAYYNNHFECVRLETERVRTGFCNPELDEKVTMIRNETDPETRQAMLEDLVMALTEEHMPWVPMFIPAEVWAMQPYVNGFAGSSTGQMFDLQNITLDR